jgi:hypothetical protein
MWGQPPRLSSDPGSSGRGAVQFHAVMLSEVEASLPSHPLPKSKDLDFASTCLFHAEIKMPGAPEVKTHIGPPNPSPGRGGI